MTCLETLAQMSIMTNCAMVYFTSKIYHQMFVMSEYESSNDTGVKYIPKQSWDFTKFLMFVVFVEHIVLIFKMMIENEIEDTPSYVVNGKIEREKLVNNFLQIRDLGDEYVPPEINNTIQKAKKKLDGKGLISLIA